VDKTGKLIARDMTRYSSVDNFILFALNRRWLSQGFCLFISKVRKYCRAVFVGIAFLVSDSAAELGL